MTTRYVQDAYGNDHKIEVGQKATMYGYSDRHPFEITKVGKDGKWFEVRRIECELDPEWKPIMEAGGFAGHCVNNREQRWLYGEVVPAEEGVKDMRFSLRKTGEYVMVGTDTKRGTMIGIGKAVRFHDYNF